MKQKFKLIYALSIVLLSACGQDEPKQDQAQNKEENVAAESTNNSKLDSAEQSVSIKPVIDHYLHLKNALANDDGKEAASAGKAMVTALREIDKAKLDAEQKKVLEDIEDDAKEHAEHIAANAGKIEHQREHFVMLSKDMYDLVKAFGSEESLYQDFCPMANDGKGAGWLSETKEIKNPYYGKDMATCGSIKEEINQK